MGRTQAGRIARRSDAAVRCRRAGLAAAAAVALAATSPQTAEAHGIGGAPAPAIPGWLFAWGAAAALAISFAAMGALWRSPQLERVRERRLCGLPRWLGPLCGALGIAAFAGLVYAGLAGAQNSLDNILPTWVFVVFWVAVPVLSSALGDVFRAFNPWRALARALRCAARRGGVALPDPVRYPARLGCWHAAATILAFGWLELAYADREDPTTLAVLALAYAALQLTAMTAFGIETWTRRGDGFAVYFGLFGRLSPLAWHDGKLWLRRPLAGAAQLRAVPGTVALICTGLGVTTFDGLSAGPVWLAIVAPLQSAVQRLGLAPGPALELVSTAGLAACVAAIAAAYRLGVAGMRAKASDPTAVLAGRYAHSLIPIALAYTVAHYSSLLIFQGQAVVPLVSDPLGDGANWLGTAAISVDYGLVGQSTVWIVQVVAVVAGHVAGLALAHDRALATSGGPRAAARSQQAMLAIMIGLTSLALWLISSSNQ